MATLTEIKNQVHTIENISEEVFKYEMEISHLHENSEYYIIEYNKIYTSKGYNYILKNADGNFYWATPGTKNFIESEHYIPEFEIKTYSFYKLIDKQGNTYLDDSHNPILELEADFKKVDKTKVYKPVDKATKGCSNKVVDDYYVSRYIYGVKYTLDTNQSLTAVSQKLNSSKPKLNSSKPKFNSSKPKFNSSKSKLNSSKPKLNSSKPKHENELNDVVKSHIDNLEKYFKQYHEEHEIREDIKFRFDNLEKYVKENYENETKCFIKFYINDKNKEKLKIHLDNIEKYFIDYYEAEARRILIYYFILSRCEGPV